MEQLKIYNIKILSAILVIFYLVIVSVADGKASSGKDKDMLRILYGGGLMDNIEPCG